MPETPEAAFDRGHIAGGIEEQLRAHDKHFSEINGSVLRTAQELTALRAVIQQGLSGLRLDIQGLTDQAKASDATVIATAKALKDAEEARRNVAETRWSPFAKLIAAVAGMGSLAALIAWVASSWPK